MNNHFEFLPNLLHLRALYYESAVEQDTLILA